MELFMTPFDLKVTDHREMNYTIDHKWSHRRSILISTTIGLSQSFAYIHLAIIISIKIQIDYSPVLWHHFIRYNIKSKYWLKIKTWGWLSDIILNSRRLVCCLLKGIQSCRCCSKFPDGESSLCCLTISPVVSDTLVCSSVVIRYIINNQTSI